jgi:hypothetical protein
VSDVLTDLDWQDVDRDTAVVLDAALPDDERPAFGDDDDERREAA